MIRVSVIIPSYCPGAYLWECLDSLDRQSFPKSDFEVILVLNGCNEPYYSQIQEYLYAHPELPCRLLQTDKAGVSNARNLGMDASRGEYISFIDDDDFVSSSYLEELFSKANKETISLCRPVAFLDGDKDELPDYRISKEYSRFSKKGKQPFSHPKKFFSGPCMKLIHKEIIGDRRFDIRFKNGEDSLFMFLLSDRMKWCDFTSPEAVYYRRFRGGSAAMSRRGIMEKAVNSFRLIWEYTKLYLKGFPHYSFTFYGTRVLGSIRSIF